MAQPSYDPRVNKPKPAHRWRPGLPIPKPGDGLEPDAFDALARNAEAHAQSQQEQRKGGKRAA